MGVLFLRSIIVYLTLVLAMRVMGKRQIGEMQPDELAISLLLAEVASTPIGDVNMPLLSGVLPVVTLLALEVILSFFSLKSCRIRELLAGRPSILIHNGKIDQKELEKVRLNMDDLLKELRLKDVLDIQQVRYAILETNGQLSVFCYEQYEPPTVQDLKLTPQQQDLPFLIISGGKINRYNLQMLGKDESWLCHQLRKAGLRSHRQALYMSCDEKGQVTVIPRQAKEAKS
ncbi:MAG: DUF421 domain-containing protein [Eubacteriales bacterium]|jgi:uncharacterized membrane protein YcaP (DUF421 family)